MLREKVNGIARIWNKKRKNKAWRIKNMESASKRKKEAWQMTSTKIKSYSRVY